MKHNIRTPGKLLLWLLALALVLSTIPAGIALAAQPDAHDVWDGTTEAYAGGNGSAATPYEIANAKQLAYLLNTGLAGQGTESNSKYYKLTDDIYLNDVSDPDWRNQSPKNWADSGNFNDSSYRFYASLFDGDGHTIYGLYCTGGTYAGLFPVINIWNNKLVVKNLTIADAYIESKSGGYAGAIAGGAYIGNTLTFSNVYISEDVTINGTNKGVLVSSSSQSGSAIVEHCGSLVKDCTLLGKVGNKTTVTDSFVVGSVGGTSVTFTETGDVSIDQMRQAANDAGEPDAVIQTTSTNGVNGYLMRTTTTSPGLGHRDRQPLRLEHR